MGENQDISLPKKEISIRQQLARTAGIAAIAVGTYLGIGNQVKAAGETTLEFPDPFKSGEMVKAGVAVGGTLGAFAETTQIQDTGNFRLEKLVKEGKGEVYTVTIGDARLLAYVAHDTSPEYQHTQPILSVFGYSGEGPK